MSIKLKERIAAVGCFVLFCYAFIQSRSFPEIPQIMPTAVTLCGIILSFALFLRTFFMKYADADNKMSAEQKKTVIKSLLK